jgi:enamine deaminase RidA (YjgF/YER057c/UK114 family)
VKMSVVNPEGLVRPKGYNHGILVEGRSLLFVAGQVGWDEEGRLVSLDLVDQFAQALKNVLAVVSRAGGSPTSITRLGIYVTDRHDYLSRLADIGTAYRQLMGKHFPAITLVEVAGLVQERAKVEIEAIAVI